MHRVSYRDLALKSLDQLPPFSPVLNHLVASLADEDVSFAQLATVIERDTVLSGNVMRLVNSALYGRRGTVSSVRAAVSILGITKLRNYLLGLSVSRLWAKVRTPAGWSMSRFNDHAVAAAVMADLLVQKAQVNYPEGAFVAGLLHDLGRMMIAMALPDEFQNILESYITTGRPLEVCEHEMLDITHSELSAIALSRWNLPVPIQKAVLYHHRSALDPTLGASDVLPLSVAVEAANELANANNHAITDADVPKALPPESALRRLGYESIDAKLMESFDAELKAMRSNL